VRRYHAILISSLIILLISCNSKRDVSGDFNILPLPQYFVQQGPSSLKYASIRYYYSEVQLPDLEDFFQNIQSVDDPAEAQIVLNLDPELKLKAEGYLLNIDTEKIIITGKDKAGLIYGFMTLKQLLQDSKQQNVPLPLCQIRDFPSLSYRAIHIDVKHHLEKKEYYYELLNKLVSYKINAIVIEVEDKIQYQRQPVVASADALSIKEWQKLSDYANKRNIRISPLVQGLGHASFILKHDQYISLRDDPESDWAFNPLDPQTYEVQFDLYLDALEAMPYGRYLHVGGDEVQTSGRNSGKSPLEL